VLMVSRVQPLRALLVRQQEAEGGGMVEGWGEYPGGVPLAVEKWTDAGSH
jgi:hypothetical protein